MGVHLHLNSNGNYSWSINLRHWTKNSAAKLKVGFTKMGSLMSLFRISKNFSSMEAVEKLEFGELKRVRLILLQGLGVVLMEIARTIAFAVLPSLAENLSLNIQTLLNVLANSIELLASSAHPLIYIMFR